MANRFLFIVFVFLFWKQNYCMDTSANCCISNLLSLEGGEVQSLDISGVLGFVVLSEKSQLGDTVFIYSEDLFLEEIFVVQDEYSVLDLRCLEVTDDFYKVKLNDDRIGLIEICASKVCLHSFEQHILNLFSVGIDLNNPPHEFPVESAKVVLCDFDDFFYPVKMEGNWLQVKFKLGGEFYYGWIKWRNGNKIILDFYYFA